jgi:transcriptional regulator NrdR family protein
MDCPKCGAAYMISTKRHDIRVDSLPAERKRRYCPACGYRGDFIEIPESLLQTLQKQAHEERVKEEVDKFRAYLAGVDRALGRLVDAAEAGAGAIPVLADRLRTRQTERREVERALQDAQRRRDALDPEPVPAAVIAAFCEDLAQVLTAGDVVAVRRLLDQVVVEVRAWPDGRGEVDYRAPWPGGATGSARFSWV